MSGERRMQLHAGSPAPRAPISPTLARAPNAYDGGTHSMLAVAGKEVAAGLLQRGAHVVMGCRNMQTCDGARQSLLEAHPQVLACTSERGLGTHVDAWGHDCMWKSCVRDGRALLEATPQVLARGKR